MRRREDERQASLARGLEATGVFVEATHVERAAEHDRGESGAVFRLAGRADLDFEAALNEHVSYFLGNLSRRAVFVAKATRMGHGLCLPLWLGQ